MATTFLTLGNTNLEDQDKETQLVMDVVGEQLLARSTRAFLAQTIGCAHYTITNSDPIPTRDYYACSPGS